MGCASSAEPNLLPQPKAPRPFHGTKYPRIDYVTGQITWVAYDKPDTLLRQNATTVEKANVPNWSPAAGEWR
jgi:hypothetical protein